MWMEPLHLHINMINKKSDYEYDAQYEVPFYYKISIFDIYFCYHKINF